MCMQGEDIVHYNKEWLEKVVKNVGMADTHWGCGQRVLYNNIIIEQHLLRALVTEKAHLDAVS